MTQPIQEKTVEIKADTIVGTVYSQLVGVTITDTDLTLEFVYLNPRPTSNGSLNGQVVARVTLPIEAARGLPDAITSTLKTHFDKKGS